MPALPAVVFIPGLLCDEALWQFQAAHLAGLANVSMADTYQDDSIARMTARILAAAPEEFAVCALSMGGYVALEMMRVAPQRITRLVLADTSARLDSEQQRQRRLDFIALAGRGKFRGMTPRLLPSLLGPESLQKPGLAGIVVSMSERLGRDVYLRQQTAIMGRIDSLPTLKTISCPTAIVVGEHDQLTPVDTAQEMAAEIRGACLHVVPQAGHLTPLESPQIFNQVLTDIIQS